MKQPSAVHYHPPASEQDLSSNSSRPGFSTVIQETVLGSGTRRKTAKGRGRNPNKPHRRTGPRNHSKKEWKDDYNVTDEKLQLNGKEF